jgi:hypothetical protein
MLLLAQKFRSLKFVYKYHKFSPAESVLGDWIFSFDKINDPLSPADCVPRHALKSDRCLCNETDRDWTNRGAYLDELRRHFIGRVQATPFGNLTKKCRSILEVF